jgi:hypothetical protein
MRKVFLRLAAALAVVSMLTGCGLKEADVPYASDMVENMLTGLSDNDYAVFSRDFSDTMKTAIDETAFADLEESITGVIGTFESKRFAQAATTTKDDVEYTVIVYKAAYTEEDADVLVTVTFSGDQGSEKIEGLFFNSPKLRGE